MQSSKVVATVCLGLLSSVSAGDSNHKFTLNHTLTLNRSFTPNRFTEGAVNHSRASLRALTQTGTCSWSSRQDGGTYSFDLSSLNGAGQGDKNGNYVCDRDDHIAACSEYYYFVQVCGAVSLNDQVSGNCNPPYQGTADVVQVEGASCTGLTGSAYTWRTLTEGDPTKGVTMDFSFGEKCDYEPSQFWRALINLPCEPTNSVPNITNLMHDPGTCQVTITIPSAAACPTFTPDPPPPSPFAPPTDGSLSWGWKAIIIFLSLLFVYVAGGCYYLRKFKEKEGCSACPQLEYWKKLPPLVWDGCKFSWINFKCACNKLYNKCKGNQEMTTFKEPLVNPSSGA